MGAQPLPQRPSRQTFDRLQQDLSCPEDSDTGSSRQAPYVVWAAWSVMPCDGVLSNGTLGHRGRGCSEGAVGSGADGRPRVEEGAPGGAPRGVLQEPVSQVGPQLAEFLPEDSWPKPQGFLASFRPSCPRGERTGMGKLDFICTWLGLGCQWAREREGRPERGVLEGGCVQARLLPPQCQAWGLSHSPACRMAPGARIGAAGAGPLACARHAELCTGGGPLRPSDTCFLEVNTQNTNIFS